MTTSDQTTIDRITGAELKRRIDSGEDVVIVDARSQAVYEGSNVVPRGAVRVVPGSQNGEIARLPRDKLIVPV